jgi:hypothetical protein
MVNLPTKNPNWGIFWRALEWKMSVYLCIIWPYGIFYDHLVYLLLRPFGKVYSPLVYFTALWCIFCYFVIFLPVLVCCTNKNLATLKKNAVVQKR